MEPHELIGGQATTRLARARRWLGDRAPGEEVLVVAGSADAASELLRTSMRPERGAAFGWHRATLGRLAAELAMPVLAERGLAPIGELAAEAVASRIVHALHAQGRLGRYADAVGGPGLPRAVARTVGELRIARVERSSSKQTRLFWG